MVEHAWRWFTGLQLVDGPVYAGLLGAALAGLMVLLLGRRDRRWATRAVPVAVLAAGVLLGAAWVVLLVTKPFPDGLPWVVSLWVGLGLLAVTQVAIPATRSGFPARAAWVYVPPAYLTADRPLLPVVVLLGGQPGSPRDRVDGGQPAQRLDDWAEAHHGLAPVVVMPDGLGGEVANPLCLDSLLGQADGYLSVDVPAWISAHLQVDPDHAHWAVGGFSYGGTCALQLAVAHPTVWPTSVDASGQRAPTLGSDAETAQAAFGADAAAELPGGHSWDVRGPALTGALPWLTQHVGLPS